MNTTSMPGVFSRYKQEKYNAFKTWLATKHGQTVYTLFRQFSETYRNAGHARCGANLIGNRIRWEMSVGEYVGFKVSNDYLPMLARRMVLDHRTTPTSSPSTTQPRRRRWKLPPWVTQI